MNPDINENAWVLAAGKPQPRLEQGVLLIFALVTVLATCLVLLTRWYGYAPLVGMALLAGLFLWEHPALAYGGVVFLIPFGAYRALLGGMRLHWLLAGFLLVQVVARMVVTKTLPPGLRPGRVWSWLGVYLLLSLLATLLSPYPAVAGRTLLLLVVALVFIGLSQVMIDRKAYGRIIPRVLIGSVSLGSLLSLAGSLLHLGWFAESAFAPEATYTRGVGGALDPNNMSLMIIFVMPLLVHTWVQARTKRGRLVWSVLLLLNLGGLIITYSRGGLLIFGLALLLISIEYGHYIRPHYLGLVLWALIGMLGAVWFLVPPDYWQRQKTLASSHDFSVQRRLSYLQVGLAAVKAHPLKGYGPGTFREVYAASPTSAAFTSHQEARKRYAHNSYLEVLVGTGVPGLVAFLAVLGATWQSFTRARQRFLKQGDRVLAELTASYRIAFLTTCVYLMVFSEIFHKYLLLAIGLAQVACFLSAPTRQRETPWI